MSDLARKQIDENRKTKATFLDLGNCGMNEIPEEIGELSWLEGLSLGNTWPEDDGYLLEDRHSANSGPPNGPIQSLAPLGGLPRLRFISAMEELPDLEVLSAVPVLESFAVFTRAALDVSPLSRLPKLKHLVVVADTIQHFAMLGNCEGLRSLSFRADGTADLSPLLNLTSLECLRLNGPDITNLETVGRLTLLTRLVLGDAPATDLAPLAQLARLELLDLDGGGAANLAPLVRLGNLRILGIAGLPVRDLRPLANLSSLTDLNVSYTRVTDLEPLTQCSRLESLDATGTPLESIAPVAGLGLLRELKLSRVSDLTPISALGWLRFLQLQTAKKVELSPLAPCGHLEHLELSGEADHYEALAGLVKLKSLHLANQSFSDVSLLEGMTAMKRLTLSGAQIDTLVPVAGLAELEELNVSFTKVADLRPISTVRGLKILSIARTEVTDLRPISGLCELERLDLSDTKIKDLEALRPLSKLNRIDLDRTEIVDLTPLTALPALASLRLYGARQVSFSTLTQLDRLTSLDLSATPINNLTGLESLPRLERLELRGTAINDLRPISSLQRLVRLGADRTEVTDLTPLASLSRLRNLSIADTPISNLAPLVGLPLTRLDLTGTQVEDLQPLGGLSRLQTLSLPTPALKDLTWAAGLERLSDLDVSTSQVSDLRPLSGLRRLRRLNIMNTPVADVKSLAQLPCLTSLHASGTQVGDLSPLQGLIVSGFEVLWDQYTWGDGIHVEGCPLVVPPAEIVKQGHEAVLNYFRERDEEGVDHLYEAKMLILGEGRAGKTSLLRRLYQPGEALPAEKDTTKGIAIHQHVFPLKNGRQFRLNVWDFGGQQIYHATHQFFLTRRSLYVLVDDTSKDQKSVSDDGFKYWLDLIDLFGGHSPVLIFQNEKGGRSKAIDLGGIKGQYDNVKERYAGNLENPASVERVRDGIEFYASTLGHIGEQLPARWIKVRADLEARAAEVPHIMQSEYFDIYARHMVRDRAKALHLSRYLHDLGVFLHFQDDPLLARTVILQNQWATEAVFRILDDETVKSQRGRFGAADCDRLWRSSIYADMHPELLALMQRFELCYALTDSHPPRWLAPQLLPPEKPSALTTWGSSNDLVLRYRYEFMPKGMISRLTVRLHRFVPDPERAWATGVLFQRGGTAVLVEVLPKGQELELRAQGPERKELLSVVAADLDALNASFQGLDDKVDKRIPCICKRCQTSVPPAFFAQRQLLRRKENKRLTVECPESFEDVDVLALLDGVRVEFLPGWAAPEERKSAERTIKIFLASSSELADDRDAFELYFRQQNDQLRQEGLYLEILRWENFLDAMSETRLQDEYNKAVRGSDVFVSLFATKTGKYAEEEFDVAHRQFKETRKPLIYTYFKNVSIETRAAKKADLTSLWAFQEKLKALGHFQSNYDSTEHLKRQFRDQLDRLRDQLD